MDGSPSVPRNDSKPPKIDISFDTYTGTLENYIQQSHVSSRWQQNRRPVPFCIEILRSTISEFARLESLGIKDGIIRPKHINIDYGELTFYISPPDSLKRPVFPPYMTYREAIEEFLVIELLGDPDTHGGEEYSHFLQTITSIKRFSNLGYHLLLQSSMDKFYFPFKAKIWLNMHCHEWKTKWRNSRIEDRPYYKYAKEQLKKKIGDYSKDFLRVVLDMELKEQEKWEASRVQMGAKQYQICVSTKNRVDVITIFDIVCNLIEYMCEQPGAVTQLEVLKGIQTLFPGFLLDLYDFLVHTVEANLDFFHDGYYN